VAGKIKVFCFDKTGTLTEDGLSLCTLAKYIDGQEVLEESDEGDRDLPAAFKHGGLIPRKAFSGPTREGAPDLGEALATCHSLAVLHSDSRSPVSRNQQKLIGDPLEVQLFERSRFRLVEAMAVATDDRLRAVRAMAPPEARDKAVLLPPEGISSAAALTVVKEYAFASHAMRMTVVVGRTLDPGANQPLQVGGAAVYCKGAPERVAALCVPESLPSDYAALVRHHAHQGYRVLALAGKDLSQCTWAQAASMPREESEANLVFLGLAIFENRVKEATRPALRELAAAHIRTVMVTGDNVLTACSVARTCGMVAPDAGIYHAHFAAESGEVRLQRDEDDGVVDPGEGLALTNGRTDEDNAVRGVWPDGLRHVRFPSLADDTPTASWLPPRHGTGVIAVSGHDFAEIRKECPEDYRRLLVSATVFARMSPDQKAQLMEDLIDLDYCVGMCGDGANDCGALKAAHVGISLSEADASVAAPFTSHVADIRCVPRLLREGRAALVTSFSCFKFMALYSFIEFSTVCILYWINSNLSDLQYLWVDLFLVLSLALFMGRSAANETLHAMRPAGRLVTPVILLSIVIQIVLHAASQAAVFEFLKTQTWFVPLVPSPDSNNILCFENTVVFLFANFEYVAVALALTVGPPHRAPVYTNLGFMASVIGFSALQVWFVLEPPGFITKALVLQPPPDHTFRLLMVALAVANIVVSYVLERFVMPSRTVVRAVRALLPKRRYKNEYKRVARDVLQQRWLYARHVPTVGSSQA
jgi:predicted P-type ATPase